MGKLKKSTVHKSKLVLFSRTFGAKTMLNGHLAIFSTEKEAQKDQADHRGTPQFGKCCKAGDCSVVSEWSVWSFYFQAEECIDSFELESAYYYVKQALELDPKHVEALEMMASVQMEMGNAENAKTISFLRELVRTGPTH